MALQITKLTAKNEAGETVELDASALIYMLLSSKGNIEISSPKNLNLEPVKNTKIKNGAGGQTELVADNTGDVDENVLKSVTSVDKDGNALPSDLTIDLKLNLADLILNNKDAADTSAIDIKFMTGKKTSKKYVEGKLKGKSIECRAICDGAPGTGGGVAAQITSCDSHLQENAWKVETGRLKDVDEGEPTSPAQWGEFYGKEGSMGIEIIRANSQYNSQYSRSYRQKGDAPMYGVTRGEIVITYESDGTTIKKADYPKQADGSQDIIPAEQLADPLTLNKLYALYKWSKGQNVENGALTPNMSDYQIKLVSGLNIKTVGGQNLLGSGNVGFKTVNGQSIVGDGNIIVDGGSGGNIGGAIDAELEMEDRLTDVEIQTLAPYAQDGAIQVASIDVIGAADNIVFTSNGYSTDDLVTINDYVIQAPTSSYLDLQFSLHYVGKVEEGFYLGVSRYARSKDAWNRGIETFAILKSTDGKNWTVVTEEAGSIMGDTALFSYADSICRIGNTILVHIHAREYGSSLSSGDLYCRSTDDGVTFSPVQGPHFVDKVVAVDGRFYGVGGGNEGCYVSSDGVEWTNIHATGDEDATICEIVSKTTAVCVRTTYNSDGNVLFSQYFFVESTDGLTFERVPNGITGRYMGGFVLGKAGLYYLYQNNEYSDMMLNTPKGQINLTRTFPDNIPVGYGKLPHSFSNENYIYWGKSTTSIKFFRIKETIEEKPKNNVRNNVIMVLRELGAGGGSGSGGSFDSYLDNNFVDYDRYVASRIAIDGVFTAAYDNLVFTAKGYSTDELDTIIPYSYTSSFTDYNGDTPSLQYVHKVSSNLFVGATVYQQTDTDHRTGTYVVAIVKSSDGKSWDVYNARLVTLSGYAYVVRSICHIGSKILIHLHSYYAGTENENDKFIRSTDGGATFSEEREVTMNFQKVVAVNGRFYGLGGGNYGFYHSTDGISWTNRPVSVGSYSPSFSDIVYFNGKYVAVGRISGTDEGKIYEYDVRLVSADGENFTLSDDVPSYIAGGRIRRINGLFVKDGKLFYGTDSCNLYGDDIVSNLYRETANGDRQAVSADGFVIGSINGVTPFATNKYLYYGLTRIKKEDPVTLRAAFERAIGGTIIPNT